MADLIVNHASSSHAWFGEFIAGVEPGNRFWMTADPDDDLSAVVRPRTHDLLVPFETSEGTRHVWCTFSADQVDFDFREPQVLLQFLHIISRLVDRGVTRLRLDAIAYLWKEIGTDCIHLPQTHAFVRLVRALLDKRAPDVLLITETNVPHDQNVSYFGGGDEAHVVYNFSLVPLILHAVLAEDPEPLTRWASQLEPPPPRAAFLNFLASHDGMGVRPAEGLLSADQIDALVSAAESSGGTWSPYSTPDGDRPYEINVSLADLLADPDCQHAGRYLAAHLIMLAFRGIPAVYVHSMVATPGSAVDPARRDERRSINRARLDHHAVLAMLDDPDHPRTKIFEAMRVALRCRRDLEALGTNAEQRVLHAGAGLFALRRQSGAQVAICITNVTDQVRAVDTTALAEAAQWTDCLGGRSNPVAPGAGLVLDPWETLWLSADRTS